ncbi:peptidyl-prolyl cis-trans isomerase [Sutcliffiella deserti]|uniref:peptidyl-prolyl cis-trans isomerase n=1 Tax=Sutcliffiella deserti TaxID=2875501 RepID=UPI001CBCADC2|nr:peptidyl-prolyl cis-trans isomerase [Sutcliffiella deserti]
METIIRIEGKVKYQITMDPGVWIFDDRRVDLDTYFEQEHIQEINELEEYTKAASKNWEREIREGAIQPPTLKTERKYEKEKLLTGSFGIKFAPFLKNAEPSPDAKTVTFLSDEQELEVDLKKAQEVIFAFSNKGKPLRESGPVHVYYGDGSNKADPLQSVYRIIVK